MGKGQEDVMINPADVPKTTTEGGRIPKNKCLALFYKMSVADIVLATAFISFGIVALVFGILWWKERINVNTIQRRVAKTNSTCAGERECLISSSRFLANMDRTVAPCDNFYKFSCGGFIDRQYIPDPKTGETSTVSILDERRTNEILQILSNDKSTQLAPLLASDPKMKVMYEKVQTYFKTCSASVAKNVAGYSTGTTSGSNPAYDALILQTISTISARVTETFLTTGDVNVDKLEIQLSLLKNSPNLLSQLRFDETSGIGKFSTGMFDVVIWSSYPPNAPLTPISILSPSHIPVSWSGYAADQYSNYTANVKAGLAQFGYSDAAVTRILAFEQEMLALDRTIWLGQGPATVDYPISDLFSMYPNLLGDHWSDLLVGGLAFPPDVKVFIPHPPYFAQLNTLLGDPAKVAAYKEYAQYVSILQHCAIAKYHGIRIPYFSYDDYNAFDQFPSTIRVGSTLVTQAAARSGFHDFRSQMTGQRFGKDGVTLVETIVNNICLKDTTEKFALIIARLFAEIVMPTAVKTNIKSIVSRVRSDIRDRLSNPFATQWMDSATRLRAIRKLDNIVAYVGLPDEFYDVNLLNSIYQVTATDISTTDHYANVLATTANLNLIQARVWKLDFALSNMILFQDWTEVNAFYYQGFNKFVLPMGFMQSYVYSEKNGAAINYATIAFIAGHEIAHAFDSNNNLFNEYGAEEDWVTPASAAVFNVNSQCFELKYSQFQLNGIPVNSDTRPQNIADNGGLKAAYAQMKLELELSQKSTLLPGLTTYTDEQMFWLAWAQNWCSVQDNGLMVGLHATDSHALPEFRVNAALQLQETFRNDWGCSPITEAEKCKIW